MPQTVLGLSAPGAPKSVAQGADQALTGGAGLGAALAVGDSDGDGYDDLAVASAGAVSVYRGGPGGLTVAAAWVAEGATTSFGAALAFGDLDGDGYDDLAVGEPTRTGTVAEQGAVHVYRGGSAGLSATSSQVLRGDAASAGLGTSVAFGDVNGDGRADLAAGQPGYAASAGRVVLHLGSSTGLSPRFSWRSTATRADEELGAAVVLLDFDGDGLDDLAASSPGYASASGRAQVWRSTGSTLDAAPLTTITGFDAGDRGGIVLVDLGRFDAAVAGDALGFGSPLREGYVGTEDGMMEVWGWSAGSLVDLHQYYWYRDGEVDAHAGAAAVNLGDADGDGLVVHATSRPGVAGGTVYLYEGPEDSELGTIAWTTTVDDAEAALGTTLATGDFDGDGRTDLAAGAPGDDAGAGSVQVFLGLAEDDDADGTLAVADCDDADADVAPTATERCDGVDNDCDGLADDADPEGVVDAASWWPDGDADGYGAGTSTLSCDAPAGYAPVDGDCNDRRATVHPGTTDVRGDRVDQDCDGWDGEDRDNDGYDVDAGDCDDLDPLAYPGAVDVEGDGFDANCDGFDTTDVDGDGWGALDAGGYDCDDADAGVLPWDCGHADDLVVDGATVVMDGAWTYRAVWVVNGGRLEVEPYGSGTGTLALTAETIFVSSSSTVSADAAGNPGGAGRGAGAGGGSWSLIGAGGGYGGVGGDGMAYCGAVRSRGGAVYGAADDGVLRLGSSGAGQVSVPGGAGGGAVGLYADRVRIDGVVSARGGNGGGQDNGASWALAGGGSGGSVVLDAGTLELAGELQANGGTGACSDGAYPDCSGGGGGGRVTVWSTTADVTGTGEAGGGAGGCDDGQPGSVTWMTR